MMTSKLDLQWDVFHDADIHVELVWAGLMVTQLPFRYHSSVNNSIELIGSPGQSWAEPIHLSIISAIKQDQKFIPVSRGKDTQQVHSPSSYHVPKHKCKGNQGI